MPALCPTCREDRGTLPRPEGEVPCTTCQMEAP